MKKILMILLAATLAAACEKPLKEDVWEFDYPQEFLCEKTWATSWYVLPSGSYVLCSDPEHAYGEYRFTFKFNVDGTYRSTGYFGENTGTYKAHGKTVETFKAGDTSLNIVFSDTAGDDAKVTIVQLPGGKSGTWIISK